MRPQQHTPRRLAAHRLAFAAAQQPSTVRRLQWYQSNFTRPALGSHLVWTHRHITRRQLGNALPQHTQHHRMPCSPNARLPFPALQSSYCSALLSMRWAETTPWQQPIIAAQPAAASSAPHSNATASTDPISISASTAPPHDPDADAVEAWAVGHSDSDCPLELSQAGTDAPSADGQCTRVFLCSGPLAAAQSIEDVPLDDERNILKLVAPSSLSTACGSVSTQILPC